MSKAGVKEDLMAASVYIQLTTALKYRGATQICDAMQ